MSTPASVYNTTLGNIAATIEEAYNNGRVVSSDEKMQYEDFLQMAYTAFGDIASIQYYNERRTGNQDFYFSKSITSQVCSILISDNGKIPYISIGDYALLPYQAGILAIYPVVKGSLRDPDDDYIKMPPKAESIYGNAKRMDDLGLRFFVLKGDLAELWGGDTTGNVVVEYLAFGEDFEVPNQVGWIIVKEVLKIVLPYKAGYSDTHEDMDPNIQTFKQRLDQPQDIS